MKNQKFSNSNSLYLYHICIKTKDYDEFEGEIYSSDSECLLMFSSFEEFIMKMDLYMDEHGPQSFQDKRSLTEVERKSKFVLPNRCVYKEIPRNETYTKTYLLKIYSRRNTEWQGALFNKNQLLLEFSNIIDLMNYFAYQKEQNFL